MEQLLHYVWRHRIYPLRPLQTTDGQPLEVIDPGLPHTDAGPDFFNAKVKLGGTLWAGDVEVHDRASDWLRHGHDRDRAYDRVVLHVPTRCGKGTMTCAGRKSFRPATRYSPGCRC